MNTSELGAVTILISTKDRSGDLRRTLQKLREWPQASNQLLVIDDGSVPSIQQVVLDEIPQAIYVYHPESAGQSRRRSEGFGIARGEYILQLDDDSYPVDPNAVNRAIEFLKTNPDIGILSFSIFNGSVLPQALPQLDPKFHVSFVGCGALIRKAAIREIGGYRDFFGNEWEEEELSLRLMKAGWSIYFFPDVLIHHYVSPESRLTTRTWMRGFRNKLWAIVMHFPLPRAFGEIAWVVTMAGIDSIRLLRFRAFCEGIVQFCSGLPRALRMRDPMSSVVLRRYDAMRFGSVRTKDEYDNPPRMGIREIAKWLTKTWWKRPRQRSFWDRRSGDLGRSETVTYAHEFEGNSDAKQH